MSLSTFCHLLLLLLLLLFLLRLLLLFSLSSSSSLLRAFYVRFSLMPRYLASSSTRSVSGPSVHPFPFHPISPVFSRVFSLSLACSLSFSLCLSPSCVPAVLSLPPIVLPPSLSFHSGLFSSLPRDRSPAARASVVFLNRSTTGGCCRAALFFSTLRNLSNDGINSGNEVRPRISRRKAIALSNV